jgi:hypothetical protein
MIQALFSGLIVIPSAWLLMDSGCRSISTALVCSGCGGAGGTVLFGRGPGARMQHQPAASD